MKFSDTARVNKSTILCHGIIDGIIALAYLVEVLKGSRTFLYFLMIAVLCIVPVIIEACIYRRNRDSLLIRKIIAWSYALLYAVAVFTTNSMMTFTYVIPMLVAITPYSDQKYCTKIGIGAMLVNVADVIYRAVAFGYAKEQIPDLEIRILLTLLICVFVVMTTRLSKQINEDKRMELETEKEKIEKLLREVMRLSGEMSEGIQQIDQRMSKLDGSSNEMGIAMEEVSTGTMEAAESVQNQLVRTEDIQKLIEDVREVSINIAKGMRTAAEEVETGLTTMEELKSQAAKSKEANTTVVDLTNQLQGQADKMNEIIALITSVANRTGMLALNASIEAARAGDAGRGFAVVATQVSDLSEQTKSAAVSITDMIQTVVKELSEVTQAVAILQENTIAQEEMAEKLGNNLQVITEMTEDITKKTQGMENMITDLAEANEDIVKNIQTISAITEEVTAHSGETVGTCQENRRIVSEVNEIAVRLSSNAQGLKDIQQ